MTSFNAWCVQRLTAPSIASRGKLSAKGGK